MSLHNTEARWGWPAKLFHWVIGLIMIGLLGVGTYMTWLEPGMARLDLTQTHKSFGFVVFVLACLRVIWRWVSPTVPVEPQTVKPWEKTAARITHVALYVLMFLLPLSGWLMASASPFNDPDSYIYIPNMVFGLFEMPDPISPGDEDLTNILKLVHLYAGYALAALLLLHVGAALKHHFILRDSVLTRMLPFGRDR